MNPNSKKEQSTPPKHGEGKGAAAMPANRIATQARICAQVVLTVLAETKNWYQVQDPATGMIGFIMRQYVQVPGDDSGAVTGGGGGEGPETAYVAD